MTLRPGFTQGDPAAADSFVGYPASLDLPAGGLMGRVKAALSALAALAVPVDCPGCAAPDVRLCPVCRASLTVLDTAVTRRLLPGGLPVWSGPAYEGVPAQVLRAWKEHGRLDLTGPLSEGLAAVLGVALTESRARDSPPRGDPVAGAGAGLPVLLIPVPSRRSARRERGEDLMRALTVRAAARMREAGPPPVRVLPVLTVRDRVRDQSGLGAAQRRLNLEGAMSVPACRRRLVAGRDCLVVDDIVTTAATVVEAVRALTVAGARVRGAATLSATAFRSYRTHT
jgi:predicted amidophosphoribosyltransferase